MKVETQCGYCGGEVTKQNQQEHNHTDSRRELTIEELKIIQEIKFDYTFMSNTETNKAELRDKFKEFVENETMIDYRIAVDFLPFISEQIKEAEQRGAKLAIEQAIDECVNALPEEIIVHEYMKTNHNMYTNEACGAWNDYRTRSVISLLNLKKK